MRNESKSKVEQILDRIRNHRWLSLLIVAGIIIIGLGAVTRSIEDIRVILFGLPDRTELNRIDPLSGSHSDNLPTLSVADIARDLESDDPVTRRAAVLSLKGNLGLAIDLLVTSSMLGAIDKYEGREDSAFTALVRNALLDVGHEAVEPLVAEWRRIRAEIENRFEIYSDENRRELLNFIWNFTSNNTPISKDILRSRAIKSGASKDRAPILEDLTSLETLELVAARRNIIKTMASLLRSYRVDDLDISGLTIRGDFSGVNLRGANLKGADLDRVDLSSSNLSDANLQYAKLSNTNLKGATLNNASLTQIGSADGSDFSGAKLHGTNFSRSRAMAANFKSASLLRANFNEAVLSRSNFSDANLFGSRLNGALLRGANLTAARGLDDTEEMHYANLSQATGLSDVQRENLSSLGAVWDNTVATIVNEKALKAKIPVILQEYIRYDADSGMLIWTRGRMSREDYTMLMKINFGKGNQNAVVRLHSPSAYLY